MFVFLLVFVGCKQKPADDHGHEHEAGGLEPLAYTLYSEKTELFVEFKPLTVGSTSMFATHVTLLGEEFKPLTEGKVTVSLIIGNSGLRSSADSVSSPGIFRLGLKPEVAGKGKLIFDVVTKDFTDQIVVENVTIYPDEQVALQNHPHVEPSGDEIVYLKEQAWKVPFANAPVVREEFSNVIRTTGYTVAAPGDEVVISAKSNGIVRFSNSNLTVGASIGAGQGLFTISGGDIAQGNIDASYQEARATYTTARANYERAQELVKDRIISEKDYLNAKVAFENAQTQFNMVGKNYSAGGQANVSTISGYIKNIHISEGEYVTAGTPLATVSKNRKLLLQANLSQRYFGVLSTIKSANFRINGSDDIYSTEELNGKVISYGKSTETGAAFIPVIFEVDNTGGLIAGSSIEFFLKSLPVPDAIVIPVEALIEEQGNFSVYVQTGGESFEKRDVKIGQTDGDKVQVFSGLSEGERVVIKGAYLIKLSTASGELPDHGHEH